MKLMRTKKAMVIAAVAVIGLSAAGVYTMRQHGVSVDSTTAAHKTARRQAAAPDGQNKLGQYGPAATTQPTASKQAATNSVVPKTSGNAGQPATATTPAKAAQSSAVATKSGASAGSRPTASAPVATSSSADSYAVAVHPESLPADYRGRIVNAAYKLTVSGGVAIGDVRLGPCTVSGPDGSFGKKGCGIEVFKDGSGNLSPSVDADAPAGTYTVSLLARYGGTSRTASFNFTWDGEFLRVQ